MSTNRTENSTHSSESTLPKRTHISGPLAHGIELDSETNESIELDSETDENAQCEPQTPCRMPPNPPKISARVLRSRTSLARSDSLGATGTL